MFPAIVRTLAMGGLCAFTACAANSAPRFSSDKAAAEYHVLAGELAAQREMPGVAANEFLQALVLVPDAELAERATGLALMANDDALAVTAARRWLDLAPTALEAREVIARLSLREGKLEEAERQAARIIEDHAGGEEDGFRYVSLLFVQEAEHGKGALEILQRLQARWPKLAGAHYAVGLAALRFDRLDLAESAARKAIELEPKGREALLLLTGVLVKRGELEAADRTLAGVIKDNPSASQELQLGYIKLLLDANQQEHARKQLEAVLRNDPANTDAHFTLGLMALEQEQPREAEPHFRAALQSESRRNEAAYYLGRIAELNRKDEEALRWYDQVKAGGHVIDASVRSALVLGRLGKLEQARGQFERLRRQYPPLSSRFYLAEGELLLDAKRPEQALALYEAALQQDPEDADLHYARSLVYERLGRMADAERDLRRILATKPDDARALNALGYMLAVHTDRLTEARDLIERALAMEPEDPAILDSMGWVQFRLGNLQEARALLEKAFDRLKDPEIAAHLGEVLWNLGDKARAQQVWKAALEQDPHHDVLLETVKRHQQ